MVSRFHIPFCMALEVLDYWVLLPAWVGGTPFSAVAPLPATFYCVGVSACHTCWTAAARSAWMGFLPAWVQCRFWVLPAVSACRLCHAWVHCRFILEPPPMPAITGFCLPAWVPAWMLPLAYTAPQMPPPPFADYRFLPPPRHHHLMVHCQIIPLPAWVVLELPPAGPAGSARLLPAVGCLPGCTALVLGVSCHQIFCLPGIDFYAVLPGSACLPGSPACCLPGIIPWVVLEFSWVPPRCIPTWVWFLYCTACRFWRFCWMPATVLPLDACVLFLQFLVCVLLPAVSCL